MERTVFLEESEIDWESLPDSPPTSATPLQDMADAGTREIEEALARAVEPIAQLQQQVNTLQEGISNLSREQKATIDRRTVLFCLWFLFGAVAWIQIIQPIALSIGRAGQAIGDAATGTQDEASLRQQALNGTNVLDKQTCIRIMKPSAGQKTSGFGMRVHPITGESKMHYGVDYADAMGSPVMAAAAGRVTMAGDAGGLGNAIEIDHGTVNGTPIKTRYGHLSEVLVKVGDLVTPGQIIGKEGSTGMSTGPHLHFEVHLNGEPVDPEQFVDKDWGNGCPGK